MNSMPNVGRDQTGLITREEVKYIETRIIEAVHEHLIGRDLFPIVNLPNAGYKWYKYYEQLDMGYAMISMEGVAQSDDFPIYPYSEVKIPIIDKTFMLQWRDVLASRNQGEGLLDQVPRNAARQIAEEEDKLLLTGEYTGWAALGILGLLQSAGNSAAASGAWPANAIADVNTARTALENAGFIGVEPIMIGQPTAIKCLDRQLTNTDTTYRKFLLNNGLVRAIYETRNLFAADGGTDSVLLVIPGRDNFFMVSAMEPNTRWWQDKAGNYYGTVREAVAPVIPRGESIYEISAITCS
jgi:uncharacterized linocin/CFP29 family protein